MSVDEETRTTKEKILIAANELFAKNGFSGASIREIATMANVNLAAINYHFKNKENLYWERGKQLKTAGLTIFKALKY